MDEFFQKLMRFSYWVFLVSIGGILMVCLFEFPIATIIFLLCSAPVWGTWCWFKIIEPKLDTLKSNKNLENSNVSNDELTKEKERRNELLKEMANKEKEIIQEKNQTKQNDYDKWVENIKSYKGYVGKDFFNIKNVGLIWYENKNYYLYIVDTSKSMYEEYGKLYENGVIISPTISVNQYTNTYTTHHNNKLTGSIVGGIIGGTTGAIIGSNMENSDTTTVGDTRYFLTIKKEEFRITYEDYELLKIFIKKNT